MTTELPIIARAADHADAIAVRGDEGVRTYRDLLQRSAALAAEFLDGTGDLREARVAFLARPGFEYIATQWAVWRAGGVAVPLSLSATEPEREYTLRDSQTSIVVTSRELAGELIPICERLGLRSLILEDVDLHRIPPAEFPRVDSDHRGMILYTSGTTSRPKGVVTTHDNITAQIESLIEAWEWRAGDCIPLFLPLHHIHGIINIVCCALWSGATIEPFPRFDAEAILRRVAAGAYTLFMAVPTIYVKLIQAIESLPDDRRAAVVAGFSQMRLMVSGSAALPVTVHERWTALTGQRLLERYGMTEIGMGLSNPYSGERRAGSVGTPLPGVDIRLQSDRGELVESAGEPGEIQVRGPGVFREYWNRREATAESFDDGWFRTGDVAVIEDGYYRILGRQSVDIIKSGGYKISALEIESVLLEHPAIAECAVVGLPDETWGELVAVAIVARDNALTLDELQNWCGERFSPYKIPRRLRTVEALPRNAMGKVAKPAVRELFQ